MSSDSSYNITLTTEVPKADIEDESEVTCLVQIPNTEYEASHTVTYDGMKNYFLLINAHNSKKKNFFMMKSAANVFLFDANFYFALKFFYSIFFALN